MVSRRFDVQNHRIVDHSDFGPPGRLQKYDFILFLRILYFSWFYTFTKVLILFHACARNKYKKHKGKYKTAPEKYKILRKSIKSVDPSVEVFSEPVGGIGFTLSPYPLSLHDPLPVTWPKTCKKT